MTELTKKIGGVTEEQLLSSLPSVQETGVGNAFTFERMVGNIIKQMHEACRDISLPVSKVKLVTYVVCSDLESDANQENFNEIHKLLTADLSITLSDIENRIVLVDKNGVAGTISKYQYDGLDKYATALNELSMHDRPTVIFQLNASKMSLFRNGIQAGPDEHEAFGTIAGLLSGNNLVNALDYFDDVWINSPNGYKELWDNAEKYVPCADTEYVIQRWMHLSLLFVDRGAIVIHEVNNPDGRADLWLRLRGNNLSAIIELKVLRSFSCPKKEKVQPSPVSDQINIENAKEVVRQAAAYRDQVQASRGLACIYDMRKPKTTLEAINVAKTLAVQHSVELRSTDVHKNAKTKRIEKYGIVAKSAPTS